MSIEEEIRSLEEEILHTQKNKSTEHHIGRLKAKIARLREEQEKRSAARGRKGAGVRKAGDATVVLAGPVGAGKSALLNRLTGARPGDDPFTMETVPGILSHRGAKIQVLDLPDLLLGGDSVSAARDADLILLVTDPFLQGLEPYTDRLYASGARLNQRPPEVIIRRSSKGGIVISSTVDPRIDRGSIEAILHEYRIHSADVLIRETLSQDRFIDALESNRRYLRAIKVVNKMDLLGGDESDPYLQDALLISCTQGTGLDGLKDRIFSELELMRIFMKPQGGQADLKDPMILRRGATVGDLCDRIHKDFRGRFRYATVWGSSAKHEGQRAGLDHLLMDGDIITIVIQK
ncbi:MAG: tRNA modification GTPase TrmE [Methanosaeta sp. PtaB.Bin039]|nr:MAG: tRNA modification GTPase TrmE [Methanosaeta sp. PtaB.Bin039]OPY46361.1 MAG: tRNA modification GTPase TrmE [Methanosaeta sp. PtaU1.Bin028]